MTRQLVAPAEGERWLLVTSAYHMPRSVGVLRQADCPVTAYPVDDPSEGTVDWYAGTEQSRRAGCGPASVIEFDMARPGSA